MGRVKSLSGVKSRWGKVIGGVKSRWGKVMGGVKSRWGIIGWGKIKGGVKPRWGIIGWGIVGGTFLCGQNQTCKRFEPVTANFRDHQFKLEAKF